MATTMKPKLNEVQVDVFVAGDGTRYPRFGQTVTIHYIAYTSNGTKFDSTRDRKKPFQFTLGTEQVIPGLDEGVTQLSTGDRAKVTIPPDFAYGEKGIPGLIPPNTELIFDIELLSFS